MQPGRGGITSPGIPFGMLFKASLDHTGSETPHSGIQRRASWILTLTHLTWQLAWLIELWAIFPGLGSGSDVHC